MQVVYISCVYVCVLHFLTCEQYKENFHIVENYKGVFAREKQCDIAEVCIYIINYVIIIYFECVLIFVYKNRYNLIYKKIK